jgi:hypothetical protein
MPALIAAVALTASLAMTPQDGGSARHPQGHKVLVKVAFSEPTVVAGLEVWYGRGVEFHREGVPACGPKTLSRGGPGACPEESIVGSSGGGGVNPPDLAPAPTFTFVNGPGGKLVPYGVVQRPARVRSPLGTKVVQDARGAWPNRDLWTFPPILRKIAGIPIAVEDLKLSFGGKSYAKDYISTTGCPNGGWRWRVRVRTSAAAVLTADGRATCRR